jgi:hypothetical protein
MSKNEIIKTRTAANALCLITDPNLCAGHVRCNQPQETGITEWAYCLNNGRPNSEVPSAGPAVAIGSIRRLWEVGVNSCHRWFTCSPLRDDAFLRARFTSGKQPRDDQSKHSTPGSWLIHDPEPTDQRALCNQRISSVDAERNSHEKILHGKRSSRLVLHGRQPGRA